MKNNIILSVKNITKSFPGVKALNNVSLDILRGHVHAIVGENGAGKSTLMKILSGVYQADEGEIFFKGEKVKIANPLSSQQLGISIIYQELNLVPSLTVAENIFLGKLLLDKLGTVNWKLVHKKAEELLERLGYSLPITSKVKSLSVAEQQMVEIAKALSIDSKLIIMDEPSSSLTEKELVKLFEIIKNLNKKNITVIYISHKLEEIFQICHEVTVFRDGNVIVTNPVADVRKEDIISMMVGRSMETEFPGRTSQIGDEVLRVENLSRKNKLSDISFSVNRGEILGIAGLVGSGRTEIVQSIFGADKLDSGSIFINGKYRVIKNIKEAIKNGIGMVTEDRKTQGLALSYSAEKNISMANLQHITKNGFIRALKEQKVCEEYIKKLKIKIPSPKNLVAGLSGGNQQKCVLAKWLFKESDILILDEPTRGIDVGAKYEIYILMNELVRQGKAIILISSELSEVLGMSDRILIIHEGKIKGELSGKEASPEKIMGLALS